MSSRGSSRDRAEVVVVGYGVAGAAAAIEAARAGTDVTLVERSAVAGGTSALSGGEIYLGGGTATQVACGVDDDRTAMATYLRAALGPGADAAKIELYSAESIRHYEWWLSCGVEFRPELAVEPAWAPAGSQGLMWLGENAEPFASAAPPAPRGHRPPSVNGGEYLMRALRDECRVLGVEVLFATRARRLIVTGGSVSGVVVRGVGVGERELRAEAVVLATGGFVDDAVAVAEHVPAIADHQSLSDGNSDGWGIAAAQSLGASVANMENHQLALRAVPAQVVRGILVDGSGRRFVNEDRYPGHWSRAAFERPQPIFLLLDETGHAEIEADHPQLVPDHVAEDVRSLAVEAGLPADTLETTWLRYCTDAATGRDVEFGKASQWMRPLVAPFALYRLTPPGSGPAHSRYAAFTLGGLRTDLDGRVLTHGDGAIPGLFAAGRVTAGLHGAGYVSGTSLGDGSFFGCRAGAAAARFAQDSMSRQSDPDV